LRGSEIPYKEKNNESPPNRNFLLKLLCKSGESTKYLHNDLPFMHSKLARHERKTSQGET